MIRMTFETIIYEVENQVAWLRLNRPDKLNAFTFQMNHEIKDAIKQASNDESVRCVVITGEGRAFCSGQDLSEVKEGTKLGDVLRNHYVPMVKQIRKCDKPIIAAVNGVAAGAGFSLALACDFRVMSEKASFINAFIHVGLIPDSGNLYFLTRLVGEAKAAEISILGEKISADEAMRLGLANKVFPEQDWLNEVKLFSDRLANSPTKTIGLIKKYIQLSSSLSFDEFLEKEAEGQTIAGLTKDHHEGIEAFLQKRKPIFTGK